MPGAVQFIYVQEGTDPKEEYEKLCQKRKDSLQPDIANTRYVGSDILDRTYSEAYKEKMYNDVVYKHLGDRGCCHCIDLGIVGYKVRSLIKKSFPQNNKKCRPVYYVYTGDTMVDQAFSSRKEATDYAMDHFCEYVCGIKIVEKKCVG